MRSRTLLVLGLRPVKVGGMEMIVHEICAQTARQERDMVLAFASPASEEVRQYFLSLGNVTFDPLPNPAAWSISTVAGFCRLVWRHRPDTVVYSFDSILRVFPWLSYLLGVRRVIYHAQSSRPVGYVCQALPWPKRMLARFINWPLTRVVCGSRYLENCFREEGMAPDSKLITIYNGVQIPAPSAAAEDKERGLLFRARYGIPPEAVLIMQVSWMAPHKGIEHLLEAAALVRRQNSTVRFAMVGDGPCRREYEQKAHELGLTPAVVWTGGITDLLGDGAFAAADVMCQMSQWEEAMGLAVLQSMAAGKPVVASCVGGIPEAIEDGYNGFLIARQDPDTTAGRILALAADKSLRDTMGRRARERCAERFALTPNVTALLKEWAT